MAGKKFQLRFRFDANDTLNNAGSGWFVENIQVYAGTILTPTATVDAVEPFASGNANGWQFSAAQGGVKFAIDALPAAPGKFDGNASLNFNNDTNYANGVSTVTGSATSPIINLTGFFAGTKLSAVWRTWWDTEGGSTYDKRYVEVTDNAGTTFVVSTFLASSGNAKGWIYESLDLTAFAGKKVQLRYRFDTVDEVANSTAGWFIDALTLTAAPVPTFADGIGCSDKTKWTIANAQTGVVWAIDASANPPGYASADCSLNFNDATAFACTSGKVSGTATSSAFVPSAPPVGKKAYLVFALYFDVELSTSWDILKTEISDHGYGTAANVIITAPKTTMGAWTTQKIDITTLAAKSITVRFNFDSGDCTANAGKGVFVDDVRVEYGL
ncbi:MAG: hypothetical protein EXR77_07675 [Myxococcales bacterium]|nr:hypothetical protein [Myxococcales bacterium]